MRPQDFGIHKVILKVLLKIWVGVAMEGEVVVGCWFGYSMTSLLDLYIDVEKLGVWWWVGDASGL